jgi:hypothetical protein
MAHPHQIEGCLIPSLIYPQQVRRFPKLRNRELVTGQGGTLVYRFELDYGDGYDYGDAVVEMFVDGEPVAILPGGVTEYQTAPLSSGNHDVEAIVNDETFASFGGLTGAALGRRVRLQWGRSTAADLASYQVQRLISSVWTTIATLAVYDFPDITEQTGGTGTGRVNINGNWTGGRFNGTKTAVWTAPSTLTYDSVSYPIEGPGIFTLPSGVFIEFLDALSTYSTGDTWTITIGPATTFTTEELTAGTQEFRVLAVDEAGNASSPSNTVSVTVVQPLAVPVGFTATVTGGTLTVAVTSQAAGTRTRVYTNFSDLNTTAPDEYVNEQLALIELTTGDTSDTYSVSALNGELLLYARTHKTSTDEEEDNITLYRIPNGTAASIDYAPPSSLTGNPGPAGVAIISWLYYQTDLIPTRFAVYQFSSLPTQADVDAASPLATVSYTGGNGTAYSHTTAALAGQRWFVVRAENSSGIGERNAVSVTVTPDSTAPTVGTLTGGLVP